MIWNNRDFETTDNGLIGRVDNYVSKQKKITTLEMICAMFFTAIKFALLLALLEVNFNLFNTLLGKNGSAASGWWLLLEIPLLALSNYALYKGINDEQSLVRYCILSDFLLVLAICGAAGFNFSVA